MATEITEECLPNQSPTKSLTSKVKSNLKISSEPTQVTQTGDWALDSKTASILTGYWEDPFLSFFNNKSNSSIPRRTSLICRGYYVRYRVCDFFLRSILDSTTEPLQIVSLGSGMDTSFYRLFPQFENKIRNYYEVDFKSTIEAKKQIIEENELLKIMASNRLILLACDLRNLTLLHETLVNAGLDPTSPVLFYSECVVNYLKKAESEAILKYIVDKFPNSLWLAYEQCFAHDSFGKIMVRHFTRNGCPILSLTGTLAFIILSVLENVVPKLELSPITLTDDGTSIEIYNNVLAGVSNQNFCLTGHIAVSCRENELFLVGGIKSTSTRSKGLTAIKFEGNSTTTNGDTISETSSNSLEVLPIKNDSQYFERVYSSAVFHKPSNSFYMFGGRKSPQELCTNDLIQVHTKSNNIIVKTINSFSDGSQGYEVPQGRWRHSMVLVSDSLIILFGGKNNVKVFDDLWIFSFSNCTWKQLKYNKMPSSRHSHSLAVDNENKCVYCIGGLRDDDTTFCIDSIWKFDVSNISSKLTEDEKSSDDESWLNLPNLSMYGRRIGHSSLIHNDILYIIGGYGANSSYSLNHFATLIHIKSHAVRTFNLELGPSNNNNLFIPFGCSATIVKMTKAKSSNSVVSDEVEEKQKIAIVGGGGNCFSFGSHYNSFTIMIPLNNQLFTCIE